MPALVTVLPAPVTREGKVSPIKAGVLPLPIITVESPDPETERKLPATILTNYEDSPHPDYPLPFHCPLPNHFSNAETHTHTQSGGVEGASAHVHVAGTLLPAQEVMEAEPWFPAGYEPKQATLYPPGKNSLGIEYEISDDAWVAIGLGDMTAQEFELPSEADPDLEKVEALPNIKISLPNGSVLIDKLLPGSSAKFIENEKFPPGHFINLHQKVRLSGTYNFAGARLDLHHSNLNSDVFRELLEDYDDKEVCQFIQYGFPLSLAQEVFLEPALKNHKSSYSFFSYIDSFLQKELDKHGVAGPLPQPPFNPTMLSPMMTSPKNTGSRRPVFDSEKLKEITTISKIWSRKTVATKQELQSVLGKLMWRSSGPGLARIVQVASGTRSTGTSTNLTGQIPKFFRQNSNLATSHFPPPAPSPSPPPTHKVEGLRGPPRMFMQQAPSSPPGRSRRNRNFASVLFLPLLRHPICFVVNWQLLLLPSSRSFFLLSLLPLALVLFPHWSSLPG